MLLLLLACSTPSNSLPDIADGKLIVCLDGAGTAKLPVRETIFSGTVTSAGRDDCGSALTIDNGLGEVHTVSLVVTDEKGEDMTPDLSVALGETVDLYFTTIQPWGTTSGFTVTGEDGLWIAADEGQWGGALTGHMPDGLSVVAGDEEIAYHDEPCGGRVGSTVVFQGDEILELTPVSEGALTVEGTALTATAVRAYAYQSDDTCSLSDATGALTWVLSR